MIDPLSAAALAAELATACVKTVKVIKGIIEATKKIKGNLIELVDRVERMRNILELLRSLSRELDKTVYRKMSLNLNADKCRQTMNELGFLADKLATINENSHFLAGFHWKHYEKDIIGLVEKLRHQEQEIVNILTFIVIHSSLKSERELKELREDIEKKSQPIDPFDGLTLVDDSLKCLVGEPAQLEPLRTWLGHMIMETYGDDESYLSARSRLSDAAYWGRWKEFWEALSVGNNVYAESWINATRLKPLKSVNEMSCWTPLHQAVYNHFDDNATVKLLESLIQAGASRTLRTQWADEFRYFDMTPLDLAQSLGYESLFSILSPVIQQTVPTETLKSLQRNFHNLIKVDLGDRVQKERIRLPVLDVLTEMKDPFMWFPLRKHKYSPSGYAYRLDGRELLVKSYNIQSPKATMEYRISETETRQIEQALVFL